MHPAARCFTRPTASHFRTVSSRHTARYASCSDSRAFSRRPIPDRLRTKTDTVQLHIPCPPPPVRHHRFTALHPKRLSSRQGNFARTTTVANDRQPLVIAFRYALPNGTFPIAPATSTLLPEYSMLYSVTATAPLPSPARTFSHSTCTMFHTPDTKDNADSRLSTYTVLSLQPFMPACLLPICTPATSSLILPHKFLSIRQHDYSPPFHATNRRNGVP